MLICNENLKCGLRLDEIQKYLPCKVAKDISLNFLGLLDLKNLFQWEKNCICEILIIKILDIDQKNKILN